MWWIIVLGNTTMMGITTTATVLLLLSIKTCLNQFQPDFSMEYVVFSAQKNNVVRGSRNTEKEREDLKEARNLDLATL
jgi:hypothetical protein